MTHNKLPAPSVIAALKLILSTKTPHEPFTVAEFNGDIDGGAVSGLSGRGYIKKIGEIKKPDAYRKRAVIYQLTRDGLKCARRHGIEVGSEYYQNIGSYDAHYIQNDYRLMEETA